MAKGNEQSLRDRPFRQPKIRHEVKHFRVAQFTRVLQILLLGLLLSTTKPVLAIDLPFLGANRLEFEIVILPGKDDGDEHRDEKVSASKDRILKLGTQLREEIERQREFNLTLKEIEENARIVRTEAQLLEARLRSLGYYQGQVRGKLKTVVRPATDQYSRGETREDFTQPKKRVRHQAEYTVSPGPRYLIDAVAVQLHPAIDTSGLPRLPVTVGKPLVAENVFLAMDELTNHIAANYCFFEINLDYRAAVSHANHRAAVTLTMQDSQQVDIGAVNIEGLATVDPVFLAGKPNLKPGDCFKSVNVDQGRLALLRTNLLARVITRFNKPAEGIVDITYEVQERRHRTISAGVGYSTDEDFNASMGWEHRNIFGKSEKLDIDAKVSKRTVTLEGGLEFPNFLRDDLTLELSGEGQRVNRDTYESKSVEAGAELSYRFHQTLTFSLGSQVKYSDIRDGISATEFYLLSFPLQATWDRTNNLLDPTRGWVLFAEISPYSDIVNANTEFVKTTLSGSAYHSFDNWLSPTFAVRLAMGTIRGETTLNIPADERFYVGGGGSVRGYPFQSLSQQTLNDDDELIRTGGSSFQELTSEMRFRINADWGFVTFVDGGYAFGETSPNLDEALLWSAGFGVRYYTLVAPLRFDIAFPLDRRADDDSYQLYISLGQAF